MQNSSKYAFETAGIRPYLNLMLKLPYNWKIALKYKVKQSKNGYFPSNYKLPNRFWNANFPPYISSYENKPVQK